MFEDNKIENLFENISFSNTKTLILNRNKILEDLNNLLMVSDLKTVKNRICNILLNVKSTKDDKEGYLNIVSNGSTINLKYNYFAKELKQILETYSIERTHYYIERLIKGLSEIRTNKINDLNLNRWKEYDDILTDSLWIMDKRDNSGAHNSSYWGNFIPQIPNQLYKRYTKKGDWILDPFLGSGTSLIECKRLGRNGIGLELQRNVSELAKKYLATENNKFGIKTEIVVADSTDFDFQKYLESIKIKNINFIILHPPYHDIIKFSNDSRDLSNSVSTEKFLSKFKKVIENTYKVLEDGKYMAIVIGDKYSKGEWIPLGFYCMQQALDSGYMLKSTIVKNFEETKGKMNQKELWRYRALVGGFYIFKHEYIFLFKK